MVTDILMNIASQLLTMGLPSIDQSLEKLLVAMETFPKSAVLGNTVGYARVIGLCLALCVGSYECWMVIRGYSLCKTGTHSILRRLSSSVMEK